MKTWDILTSCCKESYKTQIQRIEYADIQLVGSGLIIIWKEVLGWAINIWDVEKGKLKIIGKPGNILRISG